MAGRTPEVNHEARIEEGLVYMLYFTQFCILLLHSGIPILALPRTYNLTLYISIASGPGRYAILLKR